MPKANSNQKGKRGEREAAKEIERVLGIKARRGVQYQGGPDSPDVSHELQDELHIEVKRTERLQLYQALEQAMVDADGKPSIVLHRKNGKPWVALVRLDDLPVLVELLYRTSIDG